MTMDLLSAYRELGYVQSMPVLSAEEVARYRAAIEETRAAIGGNPSRINAPHQAYPWARELAVHPRLLDALERILGGAIALKSTRLFYKEPRSASYVGWHQDGITEREERAEVPAVWLGLTDANAENGCLRLVPRSHKLGLVPHEFLPDFDNLTTGGITAQVPIEAPVDVVMRAGEMSLHHPLILHGSNPNASDAPRIGFSATYSNDLRLGERVR